MIIKTRQRIHLARAIYVADWGLCDVLHLRSKNYIYHLLSKYKASISVVSASIFYKSSKTSLKKISSLKF